MNRRTAVSIVSLCTLALPSPALAEEGGFSAVAEPDTVAQATPEELAMRRDRSAVQSALQPDPEAFVPLREALMLALRNNLDIELARIDPELAAEAVEQAKSVFRPIASLSYRFNRDENPIASTFEPSGQIKSEGWDGGAGVSGLLPLGLRYSSRYQLNRADTDSAISELDREFRGGWVSELSLPLMRDLRSNEARARVVRTELGKNISEDVFQARLADLVAGVENLYWDFAAARAELNVAQKSLRTAQDLLEQTRVQAQLGVLANAALTEADAGAAARELGLIQAENREAAAKDALLTALLAPRPGGYEDRDLVPEVPVFTPYGVNLDQAIERALQARPEVAQARKRLEGAQVEENFAQNQAKPRLDLTARYALSALSGKSKPLGETFTGQLAGLAGGDPNVAAALNAPANRNAEGRGTEALSDLFRASGKRSYGIGATLEIPIGNTAGRSLTRQRAIEVRRSRTELRRTEQVVVVEVRGAVRELESAAKAVSAAERSRTAAAEALRASQERLRVGDLTPFGVLQVEEQLAGAERQWIDALRRHRNAITRVEQVQGTLLAARGLSIEP